MTVMLQSGLNIKPVITHHFHYTGFEQGFEVMKSGQSGTHAFVEVPLANTLEELWDVVETSERTGKHCMMMENVHYGREELMYLNMVRQGVLGELLHGEAAYLHELRGQMKEVERGTGSWRTK
jgi:predicted dehydrogenase